MGALKFFDQGSLEHSGAIGFFAVKQDVHVGPLFSGMLVAINIVGPSPQGVVGKPDLKNQRFLFYK